MFGKYRLWLGGCALMLAALPVAETKAQVMSLVTFDKNAGYTSGDAAFTDINTVYWNAVTSFGRAYSETTRLSPSSNYTGPVFYGGYLITADSAAKIGSSLQLVNGPILLQDWNNIPASNTISLASVFMFKQANWANYTSGGVSLSSISVTAQAYHDQLSNAFAGRWVVENGSTYYISQATFLGNNNLQSITDFSTSLWAVYNPTTGLNFDQNAATFSTVALNQVTAVGVYFENDAFNGTGTGAVQYNVAINNFGATGVPEPTTVGMLLMAAVGVYPLLRRAQRKA